MVIYAAKQKNNFQSLHFGVVIDIDPLIVRSKNGMHRQIMNHSLEYIRSSYGTHAFFFNLKKQYKNNISLLHDDLKQSIICHRDEIAAEFRHLENMLLQIAQGNYFLYGNMYELFIYTIINTEPYETVMNILKRTSTNIDALSKNKETPLMLAAQRGDLGLVKILIQHYANTELKNSENKTALMLAQENNATDVTNFLKKQQKKVQAPYYSDKILSNERKTQWIKPSSAQTAVNFVKGVALGGVLGVMALAAIIKNTHA